MAADPAGEHVRAGCDRGRREGEAPGQARARAAPGRANAPQARLARAAHVAPAERDELARHAPARRQRLRDRTGLEHLLEQRHHRPEPPVGLERIDEPCRLAVAGAEVAVERGAAIAVEPDPVEAVRLHQPHERKRAVALRRLRRRPGDDGVLPGLEVRLELRAQALDAVTEEAPVRVRVVQVDVDVVAVVDQHVPDDALSAAGRARHEQQPGALEPERTCFEARPGPIPARHDEKAAHGRSARRYQVPPAKSFCLNPCKEALTCYPERRSYGAFAKPLRPLRRR